MSVFVLRLKNITWEINGGTNLCFSKPLTRVFQVEIYSLQKTFLIRLLFHILRIIFCVYFKPDAKPWPLPSKSILFVPKNTKIANILKFLIFDILKNSFLKYLLPWKFYTKWLSLIFHKLLDFRDLENLKHPSWQSWRSDLIGDRVCVESRRNAIKMQPQQSERKISHPHTNLTSNHTLLAKIVNSA